MQKDFTMGEIVVKYKNQNYAFMQLKGDAEMRGLFPVMFDYVVKYNINDVIEHQGKAKMKFDGKTPAKKFEMSLLPRQEHPWTLFGTLTSAPGTSMTMTSRSTLSPWRREMENTSMTMTSRSTLSPWRREME